MNDNNNKMSGDVRSVPDPKIMQNKRSIMTTFDYNRPIQKYPQQKHQTFTDKIKKETH